MFYVLIQYFCMRSANKHFSFFLNFIVRYSDIRYDFVTVPHLKWSDFVVVQHLKRYFLAEKKLITVKRIKVRKLYLYLKKKYIKMDMKTIVNRHFLKECTQVAATNKYFTEVHSIFPSLTEKRFDSLYKSLQEFHIFIFHPHRTQYLRS